MKRIDLAKQNFFKQYDQLSMPTYGECFEAGYRAALSDLIKDNCNTAHIVFGNPPDVTFVEAMDLNKYADEELDVVPPCGTDEVNFESKKGSCI